MLLFTFCFLAGNLCLHFSSVLPSTSAMLILISSTAILTVILYRRFHLVLYLFAFTSGYALAYFTLSDYLQQQVPKSFETIPITVQGRIDSLVRLENGSAKFIFSANKIIAGSESKKVHLRILMIDKYHRDWQLNHRYALHAKLKRIHSTINAGNLDLEAAMYSKNIHATGYVVDPKWRDLGESVNQHLLLSLRQALQQKIHTNLPKTYGAEWLTALMLGEKENITAADWQILQATGTNHLMVIGGLHIGMVFLAAAALCKFLWRQSIKLMTYLPAPYAGKMAGLGVAVSYAALSGFSLPTQRAIIMLSVYVVATLRQQVTASWHIWSLALLGVTLLQTQCTISPSFWLSFMTIAIIIYGMQNRLAPCGLWWKRVRVQAVIALGLMPLSLLFFQEASIAGLIANSIAIPLLAILVLPAALLSALTLYFSSALGHGLLYFAGLGLSVLWHFLTFMQHLPIATWQHDLSSQAAFASVTLAVVLLLLPKGTPGKGVALVFLLPLFFTKPTQLREQAFELILLDVGQGLSAVVQTAHHTLLYDAGPKLTPNQDAGAHIVNPFLRTLDMKQLDAMVISHGDNDHIGGAASVIAEFPPNVIYTSALRQLPQARPCLAGLSWQWDGVHFAFLYPDAGHLQLKNNSSCVLKVWNNQHAVLLTGDIEALAEQHLLQQSAPLQADILIAPHHGSKTSDVPAFIAAVHPQWVLYATGYLNRYHFPHARVKARYAAIGAKQLNVADTGMIKFGVTDHVERPFLYRMQKTALVVNTPLAG